MNGLKLRIFELPPIGTNAYLLINETAKEAVLFDAPYGAYEEVCKQLDKAGVSLSAVYLTHGHWDHILDAYRFNEAGVPVYAHNGDHLLYQSPEVMASFSLPGIEYHAVTIDYWIDHGQKIKILGQEARVLHVPGHSPGSVVFHFPKESWAVSGDVVFAGSIGRTDFPGCSHTELIQSINDHVLTMDDAVILYPGHGPKTTVGHERRLNPYLNGSY